MNTRRKLTASYWVSLAIGLFTIFFHYLPQALSQAPKQSRNVRSIIPGPCSDPCNPACSNYDPCVCNPTAENCLGDGGLDGFEPPSEYYGFNFPQIGARSDAGPNVHLFSGEVVVEQEDLRIKGRVMDIALMRKYRSRANTESSLFGMNWDHNYNKYLVADGGEYLVYNGHGRYDRYSHVGGGCYESEGNFNILCFQGSTFELTFPDNSVWIFDALGSPNPWDGKIIAMMDPTRTNTITLTYDNGTGDLIQVTDNLGRFLNFNYFTVPCNAGSERRIQNITDHTGRFILYQYYGDGDSDGPCGSLKSYDTPYGTDTCPNSPEGQTWQYTYTTNTGDWRRDHNLKRLYDGKGQNYALYKYSPEGTITGPSYDRLVSVDWGFSGTIFYVYEEELPYSGNNYSYSKTIVNDAIGNVREYYYDNKNLLRMRREYAGRARADEPTTNAHNRPGAPLRSSDPDYWDSKFNYNQQSLLANKIMPNGNYVNYIWETETAVPSPDRRTWGNLREVQKIAGPLGGDQPILITTMQYDPTYNKVLTYTEPKGAGFTTINTYNASNGTLTATFHPDVWDGVDSPPQQASEAYTYNGFGQVLTHTHPSGRMDSSTYYTGDYREGWLHTHTVDFGNYAMTTIYDYDIYGNQTAVTDPRGNTVNYEYNRLNQVTKVTSKPVDFDDSTRYIVTHCYDDNGNLVTREADNIDADGNTRTNAKITTTYNYNLLNRVISMSEEVSDTETVDWEFYYDNNCNQTWTNFGEQTAGHNPYSNTFKTYDTRNLLMTVRRGHGDGDASTMQYNYDGNGNVVEIVHGLEAGAGNEKIEQFTYDGYDRKKKDIDAMGNVTDYYYDANGNMTTRQELGELSDVAGSGGNTRLAQVDFFYDRRDRLYEVQEHHFDPVTQIAIGDGLNTTKFFFNKQNLLEKIRDDNGQETIKIYDTADRPSVIADPHGNTKAMAYDYNSNVLTVTETDWSDDFLISETFVTTFEYDYLDRLTKSTDNLAQTIEYGYDSHNNRVWMEDTLQNRTEYTYDGLNRLTQTDKILTDTGDGTGTENGRVITTQKWDHNSRLIAQGDDMGNWTRYGYDSLNRLVVTRMEDGTLHQIGSGASWPAGQDRPDLSGFNTGYDVFDNVVSRRDANGTTVLSSYDEVNRLTDRAIAFGGNVGGANWETYTYDGLSRVRTANNTYTSVARSYESRGKVVSETVSADLSGYSYTGTTLATYDGVGNLTQMIYPNGRTITYTHDELNRRQTVLESAFPIAIYDFLGPLRVHVQTFGNGVVRTTTYDGLRRLDYEDYTGLSGNVATRVYEWDAMSNKTKVERYDGQYQSWDFTYDSAYRLAYSEIGDGGATLDSHSYNLDDNGNRTSVVDFNANTDTYTRSGSDADVHQYSSISWAGNPADTYNYDANGNLELYSNDDHLFIQHAYNYRNEMIGWIDPTVPPFGLIHAFAYDCFGRRLMKIVDAANATGQFKVTAYHYNDFQVIQEDEVSPSPGVERTYVYGNSVDEVLQMRDESTLDEYYYHSDDLGNVLAITEGLAGAVVERYEYEDYGKPTIMDGSYNTRSSSAIGNPYMFQGRRYDKEIDQYYFRSRYLDPNQGRFTTRDTVGIWDDALAVGNGYTFVGNNPWSLTDPLGEGWKKFWDHGAWDWIQLGLSVAGLAPGVGFVFDFANAGISLARGDYAGAALSLMAAIPGYGDALAAGKMTAKFHKVATRALSSAGSRGATAAKGLGKLAAGVGKGLGKGAIGQKARVTANGAKRFGGNLLGKARAVQYEIQYHAGATALYRADEIKFWAAATWKGARATADGFVGAKPGFHRKSYDIFVNSVGWGMTFKTFWGKLNNASRREMSADEENMRTAGIYTRVRQAIWIYQRSKITGRAGLSPDLERELKCRGIRPKVAD